jgi:FixJ family two-component response regulator
MAKKVLALVGIVDDDESVRDSISSLLRSAGYGTAAFESAEAFLNSDHKTEPDCLVLDVRMPGLSGIELQSALHDRDSLIPIIFVTAHTDDHVRAKAIQQGATAFLAKPFNDEVLLGAIHLAIRIHGSTT